MFLVEPRSGERCHYPSARALAAAIRRGELGPQARIFHQATNRWLSITVHPEYRLAELDRQDLAGERWSQRQWTFLAQRPEVASEPAADGLFAPIPSTKPPTIIMMPGKPAPSRLGLAFRRFLQVARVGG